MLDFWVDSAIISKCTENRCFPSPQQTSARRAKTAKTLDSPGIGRLPVLSLSAYATISGRSLLRAKMLERFGEKEILMRAAMKLKCDGCERSGADVYQGELPDPAPGQSMF
jgi:hypothetical protein